MANREPYGRAQPGRARKVAPAVGKGAGSPLALTCLLEDLGGEDYSVRMTIMHGSSAAMNTKGWLITLVKALLISWVLLFLTTFFHVHFVSEAGGHVQAASRD